MTDNCSLEAAVLKRISVRSYMAQPLQERTINMLRSEISYATSHDASIHFQLILNNPAPFDALRHSYGLFENPLHYIACVVDTDYPDHMLQAGYHAENIALKAVSMGLGTCFVGGTFNPQKVAAQMRVTWQLPFLLLLGYPQLQPNNRIARVIRSMAGGNHRPTPEQILTSDSMPLNEILMRWPLLLKSLQAVCAAPSSKNRHPARICITIDPTNTLLPRINITNAQSYTGVDIDLGIAMANWQTVTPGFWDNRTFFYQPV